MYYSPQNVNVEEFTEFSDYIRKRPKSFYIGGFRNSIDENKIYRYVSRRGPKISKVSVYRSKAHDAAVIRLNVEDDLNVSLLNDPLFWPEGVVCRPWVSRFKSKRNNKRSRFEKHYSTGASRYNADSVQVGSRSELFDINPYDCLSQNQL